eukprot:10841467-Lingulodinium_polyedra.AAC.1
MAGEFVHDLMLEHGLCAPVTFHGPGLAKEQVTFVGAKGDERRLDYILVPQTWMPLVDRAAVDKGVDISMAKDDHFLDVVQ